MTPAARLATDLHRLERHARLLAADAADILQTIPADAVGPYDAVDKLYRTMRLHADWLAREAGHALDEPGDDPEAGIDDDYWRLKEREAS